MAEFKESYGNDSDDGWPREFDINTHNVQANTASKQSGDNYEVILRTARRTDYKKGILRCMGQISSWYGEYVVDKIGKKSKPLRSGTGTVYKTLPNGYYLVITCAHNLCSHSPSNNVLLHPKDIYFFPKGMRETHNRMKCVGKEIYSEYDPSKQQCQHDLAIALFHDRKGVASAYYSDIKVDGTVSWREWMDGDDDRLDLWGFPVVSKGLLQGENGGEAQKTNTGFWIYDIPTYPGQSGAALFQREKVNKDTFSIYGVHVFGDVEAQENNCGVFLDKSKISWIQAISMKLEQIATKNTVTTHAKVNDAKDSKLKTQLWLKETVGLSTNNIDILLENEYDDMDAIQCLTEEKLKEMNIKMGSRDRILHHIQKLQLKVYKRPKDDDSDDQKVSQTPPLNTDFTFKKEQWNEISNDGLTMKNIKNKKWQITVFGAFVDNETAAKYCCHFRLDKDKRNGFVGIGFVTPEFNAFENWMVSNSFFHFGNGRINYDKNIFGCDIGDGKWSKGEFFDKIGSTVVVSMDPTERNATINKIKVTLPDSVRIAMVSLSKHEITCIKQEK